MVQRLARGRGQIEAFRTYKQLQNTDTNSHNRNILCTYLLFFVGTAVQQKQSQRNLLVHQQNIVFFYMLDNYDDHNDNNYGNNYLINYIQEMDQRAEKHQYYIHICIRHYFALNFVLKIKLLYGPMIITGETLSLYIRLCSDTTFQ